jgi:hypothetical protein
MQTEKINDEEARHPMEMIQLSKLQQQRHPYPYPYNNKCFCKPFFQRILYLMLMFKLLFHSDEDQVQEPQWKKKQTKTSREEKNEKKLSDSNSDSLTCLESLKMTRTCLIFEIYVWNPNHMDKSLNLIGLSHTLDYLVMRKLMNWQRKRSTIANSENLTFHLRT